LSVKTRSTRLRCLALVKLEQSAKALTTPDWAESDYGLFGLDERVAQALMRAFFVIMNDTRSDGCVEMSFAKEHQSLQALGLDGLDEAFGGRVQIRTPRRNDHGSTRLYSVKIRDEPSERPHVAIRSRRYS